MTQLKWVAMGPPLTPGRRLPRALVWLWPWAPSSQLRAAATSKARGSTRRGRPASICHARTCAAAPPALGGTAQCVCAPALVMQLLRPAWTPHHTTAQLAAGRTGTVDDANKDGRAAAACGHCTGRLLRTGRQTVAISGKNLPRHVWRWRSVSLWTDPPSSVDDNRVSGRFARGRYHYRRSS